MVYAYIADLQQGVKLILMCSLYVGVIENHEAHVLCYSDPFVYSPSILDILLL